MSDDEVFARVHREATRYLSQLIEALIKTLDHFGCGAKRDAATFGTEMRKVLVELANPSDAGPKMRVTGAGDQRKTLIKQVVLGFGGDEMAEQIAALALQADPDLQVTGSPSDLRVRVDPIWNQIDRELGRVFMEATGLHARLVGLLGEMKKPRAGKLEPAVAQVCELLQQFPDVAEPIYAAAGLRGLSSFPPQGAGVLSADASAFKARADAWTASARRWGWFKVAGLLVAGIIVTVITAGTLGAVAATLVGTGIGLASGTAGVVHANGNLQRQRDAAQFGAASPERVQHAEGELQGAWAALAVDVVTAGALGKFGGGRLTSAFSRMLRVTTISAAGGGVTTATNPNTWRSGNASGLILWGTVVGGAMGGGGAAVGHGAAKLIAGHTIQIGVSRTEGALGPGKTVKVQVGPNDPLVDARVVEVNAKDNTLLLELKGSRTVVKIGRVAQLEGSVFDGANEVKALRPAKLTDFVNNSTYAYLEENGKPLRGLAIQRADGQTVFIGSDGKVRAVRVAELKVGADKALAKVTGVNAKDLESLRPHAGDYAFTPVGAKGYFAARPINGQAGRLTIFGAPSRDHNGALKDSFMAGLPTLLDPRGRGPMPVLEEVALFSAHGWPFGYSGMGVRQAARTVADAIHALNRNAPTRAVRWVQLGSCMQGMRRFFVVGKTAAEGFQQHLDARMRELGVNPRGPQRITVLASDRPGLLYGNDVVKVGKNFEYTPFVPAGTQRPLSYGRDMMGIGLKLTGIVVAMIGAEGAVILGVQYYRDPEAALAWIEAQKERVIGWIFDSGSPSR